VAPAELAVEITQTDQHIEEKAALPETGTDISDHPKVLIQLNDSVQKWVDYFTGPNRDAFARFLNRGSRYRKLVEKCLVEQGIPKEFYYLAMIESGYVTHATSSARAVGIWQFIRGTAERYGLRANGIVDERRDPERATKAAAKYLKDLYNVFGSWRLAMAAYNAGEHRILSAIMKGKNRDFWTLAEKRVLPRETMDYVPKFFAAAIIGEKPEKFGFTVSEEGEPWGFDVVEVPSPVRLADVANATRVPLAKLKSLNPHLLKGITPSGPSKYALYFPSGESGRVDSAVSRLVAMKPVRKRSPAAASSRFHIVKRGETLTSIGRKYGLSVAALRKTNRLRSGRIQVGKKLVVARRKPKTRSVVYRVRPGDTLIGISSQFGVPVPELRKINNLRSTAIFSGQRLRIKNSYL
jgi:membrane-bound lytic murein transglycosylase D